MDLNMLMKIDIDSVDKDFLFNIENVIGDNWDVIKEEHTSLVRGKVDSVIVDIREKTIELGPSRNDEELAIEAFTFNIEGSKTKAFRISIFPKYNPDDDENLSIDAKKKRVEVESPHLVPNGSPLLLLHWKTGMEQYLSWTGTLTEMKDIWEADIKHYLEYRKWATQKNEERRETKLNRIQKSYQWDVIRSLIDGTWKPHKVVTEPNFSVKVEDGQDMVAFGYFWNTITKRTKPPIPEIPLVRGFIPGVYRLSVITLKERSEFPIAIFHNEAVSPCKIVQRMLLTKGMAFEIGANSIGRMDWNQCYGYGYGDEDSDEDFLFDEDEENGENIDCPWGYSLYRESKKWIIYFTPVSNSSFELGVKKGFHEDSKHIRGAYQIFGPTEIENESSDNISGYEKVSIGIDMNALDKTTEYMYGEVFQDDETDKNFALAIYSTLHHMIYFELTYPECLKKLMFEHNLKFKMKEFFN